MPECTDNETVDVSVCNIGGIDTCNVDFNSGVTILTGHNATNRTSLLRAIASALGGSDGSLKSDAEYGEVLLESDGETYTRQFNRENGTVTIDGDPYTDDETLVNLFACLLESNPARQAVEHGDDLRELIMRPVDVETIQEQVHEFTNERRQIEDRLTEIEQQRDRLPALEERRTTLEEERDEIETQLEDLRQEIDTYDAGHDEADAAQAVVEEHQEIQAELDDTHRELQTQRTSVDALQEEQGTIQKELDNLEEASTDMLSSIEAELEQLRDRKQILSDSINDLSAIVTFNEDLLEGEGELPNSLSSTTDDVTTQLDPMSEMIECWTCGSQVQRQDIANRLDVLQSVIDEKQAERHDIQEEIENLTTRRANIEDVQRRRNELTQRSKEIEDEIQTRTGNIADLEEKIADLEAQVGELKERIEETKELRDNDLLETYQTVSELEYERGQIERKLEDIRNEIQTLEELSNERDQLEAQKAEVRDELASLRARIEDLERQAVGVFNEHMADILELLRYENIERVWIERKTDGSASQRSASASTFDLHIVRTTSDGTVYEDTVGHLSESEREVIGLVVALAGYIAHEVYETVPMMLLDSIEAIDADRIARLVDYVADTAPYLIVALLPEDAAALADEYTRLSADEINT